MVKRIISAKVLPGEPVDGSGKLCIHLFVQDSAGPFVEPHVLFMVDKKVEARPTRGRLACGPKRSAAPVTVGNVTTVTMRTDDPRAVTCVKCLTTEHYRAAMERIKELT